MAKKNADRLFEECRGGLSRGCLVEGGETAPKDEARGREANNAVTEL